MFGRKKVGPSGQLNHYFIDDNGVMHEEIPMSGKDGETEVLRVMATAFQSMADQLQVNVEARMKEMKKKRRVEEAAYSMLELESGS